VIIGVAVLSSCGASKQLVTLVQVQASTPALAPTQTGMVDLDSAIQLASKDINDILASGTKVALLNFTSPSEVFSDYVIEEMSIQLVKSRNLVVVDRKDINQILGEMKFQMSGVVSDESAQAIGKMLGAQSIILGSIVNMGDSYRFRTKAINVSSATVEASSSINIKDSPQVRYLLAQKNSTPVLQTTSTSSSTDYVIINGVKWATRNVGEKGEFVSSPEKYGIDYTWEVAKNVCPSGWRLPTQEEINRLIDTEKVSNKWTTQNGVNGYLFTDKRTGAKLFLPATGGRDGKTGSFDYRGQAGYYWSSIPFNDDCAYFLRFFDTGYLIQYYYRSNGFSVRPVVL